jgi:hypothetical protein
MLTKPSTHMPAGIFCKVPLAVFIADPTVLMRFDWIAIQEKKIAADGLS